MKNNLVCLIRRSRCDLPTNPYSEKQQFETDFAKACGVLHSQYAALADRCPQTDWKGGEVCQKVLQEIRSQKEAPLKRICRNYLSLYRGVKWAARIAAVFVLLFGIFYRSYVVEAWNGYVDELHSVQSLEYFTYTFHRDSEPVDSIPLYSPGYLPEGYTPDPGNEENKDFYLRFSKGSGTKIILTYQNIVNSKTMLISKNHSTVVPCQVNGEEASYVVSIQGGGTLKFLIWKHNDIAFTLSTDADMGPEELIRIAENVVPLSESTSNSAEPGPGTAPSDT